MDSFNELLKRTRSTRRFTDEELTQEEVVTLLQSALLSPTSRRLRSWQFIVVDDKSTLLRLSRCKEQSSAFLADAAIAIVVLGDPSVSDVWQEDASIASICVQLQAEDLGLGSCWIQVLERMYSDLETSNDYVHGVLDIPRILQVVSIIAVGHKAEQRAPHTDDDLHWEQVHINKYDSK
jgi:nitroreductase